MDTKPMEEAYAEQVSAQCECEVAARENEEIATLRAECDTAIRERDEAIGVLLDCAPDGANAYPVGMEGVHMAAEKINAARVALLQESARRLEILARIMRSLRCELHPCNKVVYIANVEFDWLIYAMRELDAAGLLVDDNGVKRVKEEGR